MKKYITIILQIIVFIFVLYFAYINIEKTISLSYNLNSPPIELNTSILIIILYLLGLTAGSVQSFINKETYRSQIEFYARKNEKLSQQNEIDSDDKEALQRKIATLEIALENALKNKN